MITGVSGSLGSALSKELLQAYNIKRLAGICRKWQPLRDLETSLKDERFRPFIGDVRDLERLRVAFRGIDYIFHAAAIKDVIYGEYSPTEIVATNIVGTQNVLQAAMDCDVKKVMVISSDKAASPNSCYGVSKRMAECLSVAYNAYTGSNGTRYAVARYGNVVGSSGSVIPLFLKQRNTGSITLTDSHMTRFWITMSQAVQFIIQCMENMVGGEIFVPHLPSAKIVNVASAIAPEAEIKIVGIRPGEKIHEVMLTEHETPRTDDLGWAYRVAPSLRFWGGPEYIGGSPVSPGWLYTSASTQQLNEDEIKTLL